MHGDRELTVVGRLDEELADNTGVHLPAGGDIDHLAERVGRRGGSVRRVLLL
jgi:hypothetical protein